MGVFQTCLGDCNACALLKTISEAVGDIPHVSLKIPVARPYLRTTKSIERLHSSSVGFR